MIRSLIPLSALLISDALVLLGHGLLLTLLPVTASNLGFTDVQIGLTGTGYFVGFVTGCLVAPLILKRVGHIRCFAVLAASYTSIILFFSWNQNFIAWLLLRFMVGMMIAGIYMIIESWLSERADSKTRGTILSFYAMMNLAMITLSQQLLNLGTVNPSLLFSLAGIFLALSIIPVSLTLVLAPTPINKVSVDFKKVWKLSHVSLVGAFFAGLASGAFWTLAPVYANNSGFSTAQLANFMSAVVLGGALFQLPLGRISDKFDRRLILLFMSSTGIVLSTLIFITSFQPYFAGTLSTVFALLWGGFSMTLYAICLAHANDGADSTDFVDIGSSMLIAFGLSSALGAPLASTVMGLFSYHYLFVFMAVTFSVFAVFLVLRRKSNVKPIMTEDHEAFQASAGMTTPVAYSLDPRSEEVSECVPEEELEREWSDVDGDYHDIMDNVEPDLAANTDLESDTDVSSNDPSKNSSDH